MVDTTLISSAAARGAYQNSLQIHAERNVLEQAGSDEGGTSFADMLKQATENAVDTAREADRVTMAGVQDKVGTQEVVEATIALESTVKTAVAVRDKLVDAYRDIMNMPL
ncbi:flagellar hook-basal body complex protein FliE [Pseudooceanicola nanhaiensis]|uniref:flagellar hook-basal body complex protein FliE n=1 Tax=Pseudooceanicola nanhaiensis TaxID=375761 RepID=UPI001CD31679|nr:flagellar hook-basal body complex protein FliE [Pseudooceanicola nanhaiensis]MCA0922658.1 flagellar hook-basal body complex protein FliE [Pseudooceanicola nanhaiensis]